MCGIVGIINKENPIDGNLLQKMNDVLFHRGPDDEGYFVSENVGLAMRRLSIIDLEGGKQPIYNEDKSIVVVFNGEIYNFLQLRDELQKKGHRFYTNSDTEVIVHLYEEYKYDCVNYLRGMFAFALYDKNEKTLFLVRDRLGIKPLYYSVMNDGLCFASEMKSLLLHPAINKEINLEALDEYLTYLYIPQEKSIFKNIKKLLPGYILIYKNGEVETKQYWNIDFSKETKLDEHEIIEELKKCLEEAVKLHLISDVPLGAFLSGGIDSSAVVAFMSKVTSKVKTFSIGFDVKEYDELKYAREISKRFSTEHYELIASPNYLELLPSIIEHLDEPFGDASAIPTYLVSQMTRKYVKVALSGDGGDELFAGYTWTKKQKFLETYKKLFGNLNLQRFFNKLPTGVSTSKIDKIRRFLYDANLSPLASFARRVTCFDDELKNKLYTPLLKNELGNYNSYQAVEKYFNNNLNNIEKMLLFDTKVYLPDDILTKVDRMSMAHSLEVRPPLLDHKLVELCATIPVSLKIKGITTKYIFKKMLSEVLPPLILKQRKQGFSIPLDTWIRGDLKNWCRDILENSVLVKEGYLKNDTIAWMFDMHINRKLNLSHQIWGVIVLDFWWRKYVN